MVCARRCRCDNSLIPRSLQASCSTSNSSGAFVPEAFYDRLPTQWTGENGHLAGYSMCALTHGMQSWERSLWTLAISSLMYLPTLALLARLAFGISLPSCFGLQCLDLLGSQPSVPGRLPAIEARASILPQQMASGELKPKIKDRVLLHLSFVLFLLDYVSDWNCLIQFLRSSEYGLAVVQGVIIAVPFGIDCYRGKVQVVEVVASLSRSRKKGFPTNAFVKAMRSEQGAEAPLSMCLQYYMVLRTTNSVAFWSMAASLPLSLYSLSKFAYNNFELALVDAVESGTNREPTDGSARPASANEASGTQPNVTIPQGIVPRGVASGAVNPGRSAPVAGLPERPPGLNVPPGLNLPPITVGKPKVADTE